MMKFMFNRKTFLVAAIMAGLLFAFWLFDVYVINGYELLDWAALIFPIVLTTLIASILRYRQGNDTKKDGAIYATGFFISLLLFIVPLFINPLGSLAVTIMLFCFGSAVVAVRLVTTDDNLSRNVPGWDSFQASKTTGDNKLESIGLGPDSAS